MGILRRAEVMLHAKASPDGCHPRLCVEGRKPHEHCVCGLPMAPGAATCELCQLEGLEPERSLTDDEREAWDGRRYASWRRRRRVGPSPARYTSLLAAIFAPADDEAGEERAA
jgi:hypothetical protein